MGEATELTVILPNLAPIIQQELNNELLSSTLKKVINKGTFQAINTGLDRSLFNHFSDNIIDSKDLPMAAVRHPGEMTLCADPCYLHTDRDQLVLFADQLAITQQEAEIFIETIQPLLTEFGAILTADDDEHWTMSLQSMPDLTFTALSDLKNKPINDNLLMGPDQKDWLRLWNEIQMILFDLPINEQRISAGKFPINSLWLWGKGQFTVKAANWHSTMGRYCLLSQLADIANINHSDSITNVTELPAGRHLIVHEALNLDKDWQQQLQQMEQILLQPLWHSLKRYKLSSLTIEIPHYGQYYLRPFDCWKFW